MKAADEMKKIQLEKDITESQVLKLIQDFPTRWNSMYYIMLERFIALSDVIGNVFLKHVNAPPMISTLQINILKEVIICLSPFEKATKEFGKEN